jgi:hypothetical protein
MLSRPVPEEDDTDRLRDVPLSPPTSRLPTTRLPTTRLPTQPIDIPTDKPTTDTPTSRSRMRSSDINVRTAPSGKPPDPTDPTDSTDPTDPTDSADRMMRPSRPTGSSSNITNQPSKDEINELFINLKIIATTPINTKISTPGTFLNHETPYYYIPVSLKRWWSCDSRDETIRKIDRIITRAILFCEITDRDMVRADLSRALTTSMKGLRNIRETYSICVQTSARIDTIVDKIAQFTNIQIQDHQGSMF